MRLRVAVDPSKLPSHVNPTQAAALLGVSRQAVCSRIKHNSLPSMELLGKTWIPVSALHLSDEEHK
jgi:hypothetical protein